MPMTLNVIALHDEGVLLAADRRVMQRGMKLDLPGKKAPHLDLLGR